MQAVFAAVSGVAAAASWQRLNESHRREGGKRSATEAHAEDGAGEYIAEEVHAEHHARDGNADGHEVERKLHAAVEIAEHQRDGEGRHGVAGREREPIRGQHSRPAMRFNLARPRAVAQPLENLEYADTDERGAARRAHGRKLLRTANRQQHKTQRIPEPAIAHPRRGQHPVADPARSAPAVHPPHHAMVAAFDESPDLPCDGHGLLRLPAKSVAPAGSAASYDPTRAPRPRSDPTTCAALRRSQSAAATSCKTILRLP